MCWCSCRMEDQGRPSSGRRVLAQAKSSSSPLRDKLDFQFRFGVPLEQLPCLYLGDCGYVPAFLEDAGKVIKKNIDCEGLFRKSGDLRRQNVLKSQVEQGCSLSECDVHDVTSLVKFFFRLLPEPLVPCLFHDPLLACLNITHHDRRVEAVQGLCFSLPAHHLSSLRYFMRLLAHVAAMSVVNRMTARNLAVVLTPSLIRMKSRSKLMTEEELRALPRQTALVEHLICHAATIGVMTSRMFHGSLRLLEDMSSKLKAKKKKKNAEAQRKILEKQLESEKLLLFFIADLGFRPNSCHSVPDTQVMSVPNARISFVPRKKQRSPSNCTRSCGQSLSNTCKNKKYVKRVCAVDQRTKPTITYFRKNTKNLDEDLFPFGWKIGPSLLESWSNAIPVIDLDVHNDEETSAWSDFSEDISPKVPSGLCQNRTFTEQPVGHQGVWARGSPRSLSSPCKPDAHEQSGSHSAKPAIATTSARTKNVMEKLNVSNALHPKLKEAWPNCIAGEKNKPETSLHATKIFPALEESPHTTKDRLIHENVAEKKSPQKESDGQKRSPEKSVSYLQADNSKGERGHCDKVESKPSAAAARGSEGSTTSPKGVLGCEEVHKKQQILQAKVSCIPLESSVVRCDSRKRSPMMPMSKSSPRTENPSPHRELVKGGLSPGVGKVCTADPARPMNNSSQQCADVAGIPDKNTIVSSLPGHKNNDPRPGNPLSSISSPEAYPNKLDEQWVKERSVQRSPFLLTDHTVKLDHQGHPRASPSCKGQQMDNSLSGQPICDKNHVSGAGNVNRRPDVVSANQLLGQAEKSSKVAGNIVKQNVQECNGNSRKEHPAGFVAHSASDRSIGVRKITSSVEVDKRRQRQKVEVARKCMSPRQQKKTAELHRRNTVAELPQRSQSEIGSFRPGCESSRNSDNKEARAVSPRLVVGAPGQTPLPTLLKMLKGEEQNNKAAVLDKSCHQIVTSHGTSVTQSAIRESESTNSVENSDRPLKRNANKATTQVQRHYCHHQNVGAEVVGLVQTRNHAPSTAAVSDTSQMSRNVQNKCKAENMCKIKNRKPSGQRVQRSSNSCEPPNPTSNSTQRHALRSKTMVMNPQSPAGGETDPQMMRYDNSAAPRGVDIVSGRTSRSKLQLSNSMNCTPTMHATAFVQLDGGEHRGGIRLAEQSTGYNHVAGAPPLENKEAISLLEEKNRNRSAGLGNTGPSRAHSSNQALVNQKAQGDEAKVSTFIQQTCQGTKQSNNKDSSFSSSRSQHLISSRSSVLYRGGDEKWGSDRDQDEDRDDLEITKQNIQELNIIRSEEELRWTAAMYGDKPVRTVTRNRISHPSQNVPRRQGAQMSNIQKNVELLSRTFQSLEQELLLGSSAKCECDSLCGTEKMTVGCGQQTNSANRNDPVMLQGRAVAFHKDASSVHSDYRSSVMPEARSVTRETKQCGYAPPLDIPTDLQSSPLESQSICSIPETSEKTCSPGRPSAERATFQERGISVCLPQTDPRHCEKTNVVANNLRHKATSDLNLNRNYCDCRRNRESAAVIRRSAVFQPDGDIKLKYNT